CSSLVSAFLSENFEASLMPINNSQLHHEQILTIGERCFYFSAISGLESISSCIQLTPGQRPSLVKNRHFTHLPLGTACEAPLPCTLDVTCRANRLRSLTLNQPRRPTDADKHTVWSAYPNLVEAPFAVTQDAAGSDNQVIHSCGNGVNLGGA